MKNSLVKNIPMKEQIALLSIVLIALAALPPAAGVPDEAVGRVVSVISADSLGVEMQITDARTRSVDSIKLADIAAPSTVTPEGKEAKKAADALLKNQTIYIDIDENSSEGRNEWGQLICVVYLMDSGYRPVWPPVNRILVDDGQAKLEEDSNNEFDSASWWQDPVPQGSVGNIVKYREMLATTPRTAEASYEAPNGSIKSSVLDMQTNAGGVSIGYRA